jgi:hypothetical protein
VADRQRFSYGHGVLLPTGAVQVGVLWLPFGTSHEQVDGIDTHQAERLLLTAHDLLLVCGQQSVAREVAEMPVEVAAARIPFHRADGCGANQLAPAVIEGLIGVHHGLAGSAVPVDNQRRWAGVPHRRGEREALGIGLGVVRVAVLDVNAPCWQGNQVGPRSVRDA